MSIEFRLPDPGEGISEGVIVKWRISEGEQVKEHDIIADVETDKAVIEIPCPVSGTIKKLHFKVGETAKVDEIIVTIDDGSETENFEDRSVAVVGELEEATDEEMPIKSAKSHELKKTVKALPMIRNLAKKMNLDITKIQGSGKDGLITEKDVKNFSLFQSTGMTEEKKSEKVFSESEKIEIIPVKGIRKITAEHMIKSEHTAVHVSHFEEINVTKLSKYRDSEKLKAKEKGIKLTYLPFIIKATVKALQKHPYLNSSLVENEIHLKKFYNIGIAIDTNEGLIVPNIKNAETKNIYELANEITEFSQKAKNRKITLEEMKDGTFTITNIGSIGGTHATPIINYPESAILGLGAIREKPIIENGKIVVAKILPVSLSFDHRILDGAECARFTNTIKNYLENHELLLEKTQKEDILDGIL